ncbi:unnamed protein product [Hyaloperonospora brassicae]|uniref:Glycosyltransferase 2-like domain-containing protein n=1 Tax=Hyaloperonospora brassicae TaxID=162125 RepID=A0AAV0TSX6_HYABA|nr:unnamed protein product [Hyaloperonospora brassicae]
MQCVVLSATCGGSLAADGVARRTASSAVRSDAAYQWIPHDGPAALRGMDAGAQTFVCDVWAAAVVGSSGLHWLSMRGPLVLSATVPRATRTAGRAAAGDVRMSQEKILSGVRNYHEPSFRSVVTSTYSIANRAAEPVETPDVCKYKKLGSELFCALYFGTAATGVVWLHYLTTIETDGRFSSKGNFDADSGYGYCIRNVPFMSWVMYTVMVFSECLTLFLGLLSDFSMWRPTRSGARCTNDFKPPILKEQRPTVGIFLYHYVEPVAGLMQTVKICLSLQYAPELVHVFVLNDGNTGSAWDAIDHLKVTLNSNVIEICGDLRGNLA